MQFEVEVLEAERDTLQSDLDGIVAALDKAASGGSIDEVLQARGANGGHGYSSGAKAAVAGVDCGVQTDPADEYTDDGVLRSRLSSLAESQLDGGSFVGRGANRRARLVSEGGASAVSQFSGVPSSPAGSPLGVDTSAPSGSVAGGGGGGDGGGGNGSAAAAADTDAATSGGASAVGGSSATAAIVPVDIASVPRPTPEQIRDSLPRAPSRKLDAAAAALSPAVARAGGFGGTGVGNFGAIASGSGSPALDGSRSGSGRSATGGMAWASGASVGSGGDDRAADKARGDSAVGAGSTPSLAASRTKVRRRWFVSALVFLLPCVVVVVLSSSSSLWRRPQWP